MNFLLFDIISLLDYNNSLIESYLNKKIYLFDVTKIEYLKYIKNKSIISINSSLSFYDSYEEYSNNERTIPILEDNNLSDDLYESDNLSNELYESNELSNSYNNSELLSYDSKISLEIEDNNDLNSNNNDLTSNNKIKDYILLDKNNSEIYNIIKNDYINFLEYYNKIHEYRIYNKLKETIFYINLDQIKTSFIELMKLKE